MQILISVPSFTNQSLVCRSRRYLPNEHAIPRTTSDSPQQRYIALILAPELALDFRTFEHHDRGYSQFVAIFFLTRAAYCKKKKPEKLLIRRPEIREGPHEWNENTVQRVLFSPRQKSLSHIHEKRLRAQKRHAGGGPFPRTLHFPRRSLSSTFPERRVNLSRSRDNLEKSRRVKRPSYLRRYCRRVAQRNNQFPFCAIAQRRGRCVTEKYPAALCKGRNRIA